MQKKGTTGRTGAARDRLPRAGTAGTGSRSQATRERILDAAEQLFAQRGFYGVSVRDITGAADVDVALASYHFGNKQGLLEAVFMRRAEDLNTERIARLDAVLAAAKGRRPPKSKTSSMRSRIRCSIAPRAAARAGRAISR